MAIFHISLNKIVPDLHASLHLYGYIFIQQRQTRKKKKKKVCVDSVVCVCFLSDRDFQFGHMDGNDYINSLIMG